MNGPVNQVDQIKLIKWSWSDQIDPCQVDQIKMNKSSWSDQVEQWYSSQTQLQLRFTWGCGWVLTLSEIFGTTLNTRSKPIWCNFWSNIHSFKSELICFLSIVLIYLKLAQSDRFESDSKYFTQNLNKDLFISICNL